jgi:DNA polymerase III subunit epsilon
MYHRGVTIEIEKIAQLVAAHPNYRVLRRLDPEYAGGQPITTGKVRRAAIVDVETTGTDPELDKVIELGAIVFDYAADTGRVGPVVGRYSGLEDPGIPIPPETTAIHGITDQMVAGQRLDDTAIAKLVDGVGLVIAHNAGFDRPFLEHRLPLFAALPWACSLREVPWKDHGRASASLEFLAYRSGFFYDAHRAETDCRALLAVLAHPLAVTDHSALWTLLEYARQPSYRLAALGAPFEVKDLLKARGYRWDADDRVWQRDLMASDQSAELEWLKSEVYGGRSAEIGLESMDAKIRYSRRQGERSRIRL